MGALAKMRLKNALKVSRTYHELDNTAFIQPNAWRFQRSIKNIYSSNPIISRILWNAVQQADKIVVIRNTGITPSTEINCKNSILWHCPIKYLLDLVGKTDWHPDEEPYEVEGSS